MKRFILPFGIRPTKGVDKIKNVHCEHFSIRQIKKKSTNFCLSTI